MNLSAFLIGRADRIHAWNPARLKQAGLSGEPGVNPGETTGYGWYAWKPHIILEAMQAAKEGDLVVYQDVGRKKPLLISGSLSEWHFRLLEQQIPCIAGVRIPEWGPNRLWTKPSVFHELGLTDSRYVESPQVQASWSAWIHCPQTMRFVSEWSEWCSRRELVGDDEQRDPPSVSDGFIEHRWDQSLLTLLCLRDNMPVLEKGDMRHDRLDPKCLSSFQKKTSPSLVLGILRLAASLYAWMELLPRIGLKILSRPGVSGMKQPPRS